MNELHIYELWHQGIILLCSLSPLYLWFILNHFGYHLLLPSHYTWPFVHAKVDHIINSCGAGMYLLNSFMVHLYIVLTPRLVPMWDRGCIRKSQIKEEKLAKTSFSLGPGAFPIKKKSGPLSPRFPGRSAVQNPVFHL